MVTQAFEKCVDVTLPCGRGSERLPLRSARTFCVPRSHSCERPVPRETKRCSQECEHGTQSACATRRLQRHDVRPRLPCSPLLRYKCSSRCSPTEPAWVPIKSWLRLAPAEWARSIALAIRG